MSIDTLRLERDVLEADIKYNEWRICGLKREVEELRRELHELQISHIGKRRSMHATRMRDPPTAMTGPRAKTMSHEQLLARERALKRRFREFDNISTTSPVVIGTQCKSALVRTYGSGPMHRLINEATTVAEIIGDAQVTSQLRINASAIARQAEMALELQQALQKSFIDGFTFDSGSDESDGLGDSSSPLSTDDDAFALA